MTWTPTDVEQEWGQIRVTVDGKDRTFFRYNPNYPQRKLTKVLDWQDTDPYGSNNATLAFPQITEFDFLGSDELDWLAEGARVRIDHHNNGVRVKNLFIGLINRIEISDAGVTAGCIGDLLGDLTLRLHQPPIGRRRVQDAAEAIRREIGVHDGVSRYEVNDFTTGISVAMRGDRGMTRLGYVDSCLNYATKADGSSLTLLPNPTTGATAYTLGWRDLTTQHATVYAGAHGVKVRLSRDLVDNPNRIFGEGVSTNGERYRNAKYPRLHNGTAPTYPFTDGRSFGIGTTNADTDTGSGITVMVRELAAGGTLAADDKFTDTFTAEVEAAVQEVQARAGLEQTGVVTPATWDRIFNVSDGPQSFAGSMFWPFAYDKATNRFLRSADGTVIGLNPNFAPHLQHVEQFVSFGEGVTKAQARKHANATLARNSGWAGTVTLTSDPAEMSRFDLRAGMNLKVEHLKGALNQLLHIASVQVDWPSQSVTLAVSTQGRHYVDLAVRKQRNREARRDPGMHFAHMLRRSAITADSTSGWEGESGAGIIAPTALVGGTWTVIPVVASEVGVASNLWLLTEGATTYYCALFADKVNAAVLNGTLGDPSVWADADDKIDVFAANAEWLVEDERLMIEAWGTPDQPCGLWPKPYLNPVGERSKWPVNGKHRDDASWDFWTADNFLYLAVWPAATTTIRGRMRIQLNDGI